MIDLYTAATPNGWKVSITLEELELPYKLHVVDLAAGEQKQRPFTDINPNGRIPAIVDRANGDFPIFESGAILLYLAERAGRLLPADAKGRSRAVQWLMFQMGGVGPMMGQANVFTRYFPEQLPSVIDRYRREGRRLFEVLDGHLAAHEYLAGNYSIADIANWSWVHTHDWPGIDISGLDHLKRWLDAIAARPAVQKGLATPPRARDADQTVATARKMLAKNILLPIEGTPMNEMTAIAAQPAYSEGVQQRLRRAPALFIDGEWVASSHDKTLAVHDPSTGREISAIADASDADVDRAVAAARRAFDDGRWTGLAPYRRERLVSRLADLIEADIAELAELESIDNGKPRSASQGYDIPRAVATLRYMAGWATKLSGEYIEPATVPSGAVHAYVRREPIGVCAQIVPWNFPLMMAVQKIAPALAAGCTVILKPAEQTSLTALRLADLVAEAGFPAGVFNLVTGLGETAGDRMVRSPLVDKVAFTGSTQVGKLINIAATDTLKRVTLELGGKSPVIVLPDVDIAKTAAGAARSIFANAGQVCIAGSRLFAHRSIFDELLEAVAANASQWKVGPSLAPDTSMGPLVSTEQRDRVMDYIDQGRKAGASVLSGGDAPSGPAYGDGYYVNPTILVDVKPEMSVVREEIFGPVLTAQRFDDLDAVAAAANDTEYGLAASIWTRDVSAMHKLAARIKAGMVWGNTNSAADTALPFGGFKQSGFGRESGRYGIEAYTELKTVAIAL